MRVRIKTVNRMAGVLFILFCSVFTVTGFIPPAEAGGREVTGTIGNIDPKEGTFSVIDGMGVRWNYKALADAGIDLSQFKEGERVTVSIKRATPLNMMSSADYLRKNDRLVKIPY